jgi:hypothetical protein
MIGITAVTHLIVSFGQQTSRGLSCDDYADFSIRSVYSAYDENGDYPVMPIMAGTLPVARCPTTQV